MERGSEKNRKVSRSVLKETWNSARNMTFKMKGEKMKTLKHNWFMDLRHFLFGHQILWGNWVEITSFDGCSLHGKCNYCGYKGIIDSQSNLF